MQDKYAVGGGMDELSNSVVTLIGEESSEVTEELPSAGFNRLWLTTRHGRRYLLKGLKPEYWGKPEYEALLRKEFELLMRLDHPAVVRVWGLEHSSERGICIVMDYIDGVPLSSFMKLHPSMAERRRVAMEMAAVLEYIHSVGVFHRDLKPDNVMVTRIGRHVRLIDFGLGDSEDFVLFKNSGATRSFGAPEQTEGHWGDSRSDVYSFGKLLQYLHLSLVYYSVCRGCLVDNPEQRPTMAVVRARMERRRRLAFPFVAMGVVAAAVLVFFMFRPRKEPVSGEKLVPPVASIPVDTQAVQPAVPVDSERPALAPEPLAERTPAKRIEDSAKPTRQVEPLAQEETVAALDTSEFEKDFEDCRSCILTEGMEYIKQYCDAQRQGKEVEEVDALWKRAYNLFGEYWEPVAKKWAERGMSADVLGSRSQALVDEAVSQWNREFLILWNER